VAVIVIERDANVLRAAFDVASCEVVQTGLDRLGGRSVFGNIVATLARPDRSYASAKAR
jgi:hypothetical protein